MKARRRWLIALLLLAVVVRPGTQTGVEAADPMFGNGADGAITFSSNTQFNPPADAAVTSGAASSSTMTVGSGGFVAGQKILIHQTRGSGAGMWELNSVQSYALGTLTTTAPLAHTYASSGGDRAQVLVVPQYSNVTVNGGVTVSAKPWNGTVGGILTFLANGTITVTGNISANGGTGTSGCIGVGGTVGGFSGGNGSASVGTAAQAGEGTAGPPVSQTAANGNGGGGGLATANPGNGAGGSGGHGTAGTTGGTASSATAGVGGSTAGTPDLTTMVFGGGGGGEGREQCNVGGGGSGGGIVLLGGETITETGGTITSIGGSGAQGPGGAGFNSSGGAGGSILLKGQTVNLGTGLLTATGGAGSFSGIGQAGGVGRIRVEYCQTISGGFANPSASVAQISCNPASVGGIAEQPDVALLGASASAVSGDHRMAYLLIGAGALLAVVVAGGSVTWRRRKLAARL